MKSLYETFVRRHSKERSMIKAPTNESVQPGIGGHL